MPNLIKNPYGWDSINSPLVQPSGFREYDCRWRYPEEINLLGLVKVGKAIGTHAQILNKGKDIIVGNDFRSYSIEVKHALVIGLIASGMNVLDIGTVLTPMAYYARKKLNIPCLAMITASHNPNGWTGIKMGFEIPFTHSPKEIKQLMQIVTENQVKASSTGTYKTYVGIDEDYLNHLCQNFRLKQPLKVVCATGNGTASLFVPRLLQRVGAEVIPLHAKLDWRFPNYNPNPESLLMLNDMRNKVLECGADLALGFDGDGDRLGIVDNEGEEIFSDKLGLIFARDIAQRHPNSKFIVDIKSTAAFLFDPVLKESKAEVEYWKTGHSYMRRKTFESGAILGIEKSGHLYFSAPIGDHFDCGLRSSLELLKVLNRRNPIQLSNLREELPETWLSPTMAPYCADEKKYEVVKRLTAKFNDFFQNNALVLGQKIKDLITINGVRVVLTDGSWILVRASSNTPNLVVVCESTVNSIHLKQLFDYIRKHLKQEPEIGEFDQTV